MTALIFSFRSPSARNLKELQLVESKAVLKMHDFAFQDDNIKTINANTISNDSIATTMDKNHPQGEEQIQASQKGDLKTSTSETSSDSLTPTNYNETTATKITQGKGKTLKL